MFLKFSRKVIGCDWTEGSFVGIYFETLARIKCKLVLVLYNHFYVFVGHLLVELCLTNLCRNFLPETNGKDLKSEPDLLVEILKRNETNVTVTQPQNPSGPF